MPLISFSSVKRSRQNTQLHSSFCFWYFYLNDSILSLPGTFANRREKYFTQKKKIKDEFSGSWEGGDRGGDCLRSRGIISGWWQRSEIRWWWGVCCVWGCTPEICLIQCFMLVFSQLKIKKAFMKVYFPQIWSKRSIFCCVFKCNIDLRILTAQLQSHR